MKDYSHKIIAHRGASFDAPENTMPAINLAWSQQIQKVEIDVYLTKDKHIVVVHDENTERLSGKNFNIKNEKFATLRKLDVGLWKGETWKHTQIPSLDEVLATIPTFGTLIIEIKCGLEIVPYLKKAVEKIPSHQIEFICFDYEVISCIKANLSQHKSLWLLDLDYTLETKKEIKPLETYLKKTVAAKLDGLNLWAGEIADKEYIEKIKQRDLLVYIWSTNSVKKANYFFDLNVDAVTTDKPKWMLQKLKEKSYE